MIAARSGCRRPPARRIRLASDGRPRQHADRPMGSRAGSDSMSLSAARLSSRRLTRRQTSKMTDVWLRSQAATGKRDHPHASPHAGSVCRPPSRTTESHEIDRRRAKALRGSPTKGLWTPRPSRDDPAAPDHSAPPGDDPAPSADLSEADSGAEEQAAVEEVVEQTVQIEEVVAEALELLDQVRYSLKTLEDRRQLRASLTTGRASRSRASPPSSAEATTTFWKRAVQLPTGSGAPGLVWSFPTCAADARLPACRC